MKKWIMILSAGVIAVYATAPVTETVSTTSLQLVSAKPLVSSTAWVTNTVYAIGDEVSNAAKFYLATTAGITTSAPPTHTSGDTTSGTITWRYLEKTGRTTAWVTNTVYAIGDVVSNAGYYYFATNAGRTTNAVPTHTTGEAAYGTMTWRQISKGARKGLILAVQTTSANGGAVNYSLSSSAATNTAGGILVGQGASVIFGKTDDFQDEVHIISATGSNVVFGFQEF